MIFDCEGGAIASGIGHTRTTADSYYHSTWGQPLGLRVRSQELVSSMHMYDGRAKVKQNIHY